MRRWTAGASHDFDGITGAIYPAPGGGKFDGDLVLRLICQECGHDFQPKFELAFFMCDFFADNEEERSKHEPGWRFHGDTFFMRALAEAIRSGWRGAAERVRRQRERRRAA